MSTQAAKALAVADKVLTIVEGGLGPLERMMNSPGWTPEFRAIVWGAVADIAFKRKGEAEQAIPRR